ncbi:MAG TPA: hypothetical protein VE685_16700 [Thermoanaerobaculia bacterium]|nr:hypothetical protein [Thermoanaerobaculia bacterium]
MIDPETAQLAAAAVTALAPYLKDAASAAAGKVGEAAVGGVGKLYGMLKKRLSPEESKDLDDLAAEPEDAASRGALEKTLRKRLAADPELRAELAELLEELRASGAVSQTATIVGDGNVSTQIVGNRNQVWGRGER